MLITQDTRVDVYSTVVMTIPTGRTVLLWVPAAAPAMAAIGLYCESGFAATAKDIAALGHLKYDAHTA